MDRLKELMHMGTKELHCDPDPIELWAYAEIISLRAKNELLISMYRDNHKDNIIETKPEKDDGWRPISTAPMDNTNVFLLVKDYEPAYGHYNTNYKRWVSTPLFSDNATEVDDWVQSNIYDPDFWMPAPDADIMKSVLSENM